MLRCNLCNRRGPAFRRALLRLARPDDRTAPLTTLKGSEEKKADGHHIMQDDVESSAAAKRRFEAELEFVQALANPEYLHHLAQNLYFDDPDFRAYLEYLQYPGYPWYHNGTALKI